MEHVFLVGVLLSVYVWMFSNHTSLDFFNSLGVSGMT